MAEDRFTRAVTAIDAANAADPVTIDVSGSPEPKELEQGRRASHWVQRLRPDAPEALLLAARAHHVRRWEIPRASYPAGRAGYLRWRAALHRHHSEVVGSILEDVGYDGATIERVQTLVAKRDQPARQSADDPDVAALEDALCLVFVETELAGMAERLQEDHLVEVIAKTLRKMSPGATDAARDLAAAEGALDLLERAAALLHTPAH